MPPRDEDVVVHDRAGRAGDDARHRPAALRRAATERSAERGRETRSDA